MGWISIVKTIATSKPFEKIISKLLGKIFRGGDGGTKVSSGLSVAAIVALVLTVVQRFYPEFGEMLAGHEVTLIGIVALAQAIRMYFRREEVL
jgi:uncharacterized membrane protein